MKSMRGAQVHSTSGAAREAAQAAATQAEAALMAAKEKAAQTASQVCPFMLQGLNLLRVGDRSGGRAYSWHADIYAMLSGVPECCNILEHGMFVISLNNHSDDAQCLLVRERARGDELVRHRLACCPRTRVQCVNSTWPLISIRCLPV